MATVNMTSSGPARWTHRVRQSVLVQEDVEGLARNFGRYSRTDSFHLAHAQMDTDEKVPVVLEERIGHQVWLRRLDEGESPPSEPITVEHGDIIIPFTPIHSTSINTTPIGGDATGFVVGIPVIEVRRDDDAKIVFARTRRLADPEPTIRVQVPFGYQLTFGPGDVVVELEWIDQMFAPGDDGYAPLTNTIWTWMTIGVTSGTETLTRYLLAAARRLDTAHRGFQRIRHNLDTFESEGPGPHTRRAIFEIVGDIETTVISLSRAIDMAMQVGSLTAITAPVPASLRAVAPGLTKIRNAYEHIEDRAQGNVNRRPSPQEALTIFDWNSLFEDDAITYADERLELSDVPGLLLATRAFLKLVASEGKEAFARQAVQPP
jgi:hypothetical protein